MHEKEYKVRYLTHMIVFPDDDTFIEQTPFVHDLYFEGANWVHSIFHHQDNPKEMVNELRKKGSVRCETKYPPAGPTAKVTHIYSIEDQERKTGWFGSKQY